MTTQTLPVILLAEEHLIIGEVETRGRRLLDVLNEQMGDWLLVRNAHVTRCTDKAKAVATAPELTVRKADVRLAVLGGGKHESPERRRFAYVDKQQFSALAIVGGYEVRGRLHLKVKRDALHLLVELSDFIPLTEAIVSHAGPVEEKLDAEVVIVNKSAVSAFSIGDAVSPSPPARTAALSCDAGD